MALFYANVSFLLRVLLLLREVLLLEPIYLFSVIQRLLLPLLILTLESMPWQTVALMKLSYTAWQGLLVKVHRNTCGAYSH